MAKRGRPPRGEFKSVLTSVRIPGEQAEALTELGGSLSESLQGLAERAANKSPSGVVSNAIKKGILVRPNKCSVCGVECRPHGHHDDYNHLLGVRWLCVACHSRWHVENEPIYADGIEKRVVVLLSEPEYKQVKAEAGAVPLSAWFRAKVLFNPPGLTRYFHEQDKIMENASKPCKHGLLFCKTCK